MKNLVSVLLKKDPNNRPTIEEIFQLDFILKKLKEFRLDEDSLSQDKSILNGKIFSENQQIKHKNKKGTQHSEDQWGSSLFEFGFGNLLKENDEILINNRDSIISPNKNTENLTILNKTNSRHHKYSPSMNDISFNINNFSIGSSLSKVSHNTNLSKFSKNQNSFPEYGKLKANIIENQNSPLHSLNTEATSSPTKMTMEQSIYF